MEMKAVNPPSVGSRLGKENPVDCKWKMRVGEKKQNKNDSVFARLSNWGCCFGIGAARQMSAKMLEMVAALLERRTFYASSFFLSVFQQKPKSSVSASVSTWVEMLGGGGRRWFRMEWHQLLRG